MTSKLYYQNFMIGTMGRTRNGDSRGIRGKWCVNCVNMWKATLGHELNPENAVLEHMVIVLHEVTHAMSGDQDCLSPHKWDKTLKRILMDLKKDD